MRTAQGASRSLANQPILNLIPVPCFEVQGGREVNVRPHPLSLIANVIDTDYLIFEFRRAKRHHLHPGAYAHAALAVLRANGLNAPTACWITLPIFVEELNKTIA
jgi:hypothetical protein